MTVTNMGQGPTIGSVVVTEGMPPQFSPVSMAGSGWTCALASLTCVRNDVLGPGASYPTLVVTVNVPFSTATSAINAVTVAGGGN